VTTGRTAYPLGRDRAGVIVIVDGRLALIDRVRPGSPGPYSAVPGGGVEAGETPAEAAVREAREELGLEVRIRGGSGPVFHLRTHDHEEHYFLVDVVGGDFGPGDGPEWDPGRGRGTYTPVLVSPEQALERDIVPFEIAEALLRSFVTGEWPTTTVELNDPRVDEPARVRSAGFVLDDADRVLLLTGSMEDVPPGPGPAPGRTGTFYEVPGGGVEPGETPEEAVVRELEEELGLHVRIDRELATVWRPGGVSVRQHYFLVRPDGPSGRTTLDHEPFFTPVWVPAAELAGLPIWPKRLGWRVARWSATGAWPERPVHLTDVIRDLHPPCTW
jgi:8-oxo-dGTP pyrophosphatase MutT (NUDIX family)